MTSPAGEPAFSVIMPVYNHAAYVGQAIQSVLNQSFRRWELIVVDDGSTDGSGEVVEGFAARDRRVRPCRQDNAGPSAARNRAMRLAGAEWLAFLDSDDLWLAGALASYDRAIRENPQKRFFYGYRHRLEPDGSRVELAGEFQERITTVADLFARMYLSQLCVCFHRTLLAQAGGYDDGLEACEDYDLYLRLGLHTDFQPIGQATGLRRRHAGNRSRRTGFTRFAEAEVLRRFVQAGGGERLVPPEQVARRLGGLYHSAARLYFKARHFREALAAVSQSERFGRKGRTLKLLASVLLPLGKADPRGLPWLDRADSEEASGS